jgi:hypothetical protein
MLQQLDLFGGDPIKLTGKPAESKKKSYKIAPPVQVVEEPSIEESSTSIQTIDVDDFSAPALKKGKKDRSQAVKKITDIAMLDIPEDSILYSKQYYPIGDLPDPFLGKRI